MSGCARARRRSNGGSRCGSRSRRRSATRIATSSVHRDLKPSNVLVTADGTPKLVDFGIAKLLGGGADTATRTLRFTPLYASPEQIRGEPVNTSTDVFGLGLLLYELCAGGPAFSAAGAGAHAQARAVLEDEVRMPLTVPADLAAIIGMALRKEPERRYATADQMADDVRRYQGGLPVTAQPDSWPYVARKFVGRHLVGVGLATAAVVTLVALTTVALRQARIADDQRARAEQVTDVRHRLSRRDADRPRLGAAEQGRLAAGRRAGRPHRRAHRRRAGQPARSRVDAALGAGDDLLPDGRDRQVAGARDAGDRALRPALRPRRSAAPRRRAGAGLGRELARPLRRGRGPAARRGLALAGDAARGRRRSTPRSWASRSCGWASWTPPRRRSAAGIDEVERALGARPPEPRPGGLELRAGVPRARPVRTTRRAGSNARRRSRGPRSRKRRCRWPGRW